MVGRKIADENLAVQKRRELDKRLCNRAGLTACGKVVKFRQHVFKTAKIFQNVAVALRRRGGELLCQIVNVHPAARAAPVAQEIPAQNLARRLLRHHGDARAPVHQLRPHGALHAQVRDGQQHVHIVGRVAVPPQPQVQVIEPEKFVRPAEDDALVHLRHAARALKGLAHFLHVLGVCPLAVILGNGQKKALFSADAHGFRQSASAPRRARARTRTRRSTCS